MRKGLFPLVPGIRTTGFFLAAIWFAAIQTVFAAPPAMSWPQELKAPEGSIFVYQPQPEKLTGNTLEGRAAMSIELKNTDTPIFGAFWFSAQLDTDTDDDTVLVRDFKVTRVSWPDSKDQGEQRFTQIVEASVPSAGFVISKERLSASLATAEREQKSLESLKTDPPKIEFRESLAVLLLYDGPPRFTPIDKSDYERVMNTPFVVARHKQTKICYLSSGQLWYESKEPLGPWSPTTSPPADLVKMLPKPDTSTPPPKQPPIIVVATEPTEVIASDGKPKWTSLVGGKLLYVKNTETPWLRELSSGDMYVLLAGRWYHAKTQAGPWTFVRADKLPASFKEIPPASEIGGLRTSVAGTEEAQNALLDAQIPQTAAIKRSEAKLEVKYDGEPKFEKIPQTKVAYAINTSAQVLEIEGRYYAVDNGVWFTSEAAKGPWVVADKIPEDEIQKIPASAPVYNTTYVHVYHSTPEVVYVGYTPGYLWSYPYYGVPVYGTGWYYPPYWGAYYYPRPVTYGFNVGYNPWTGWSFGLSWSYGFFTFGVSWGGGYGGCCGGYYGGGYRGPVFINTGDINIGNNPNIGNRDKINDRISKQPRDKSDRLGGSNLYNRPENRARKADAAARPKLNQARPTNRANDVYVDRNGQLARRAGNDWQVRDQGGWKSDAKPADRAGQARDNAASSRPKSPTQQPSSPSKRPASPSQRPSPRVDRSELNRAHQARQSGASRERSHSAPRGGGGGRSRR